MARLAREEWLDAAYAAFGIDGLAAIRVEVLARTLGATKGSFYWHFTDRQALVDAVLARWEDIETERIIGLVDKIGSPRDRLAWLLEAIVERMSDRGGELTLYQEAPAAAVHDVVARVVERRVAYVASVLEELGFEPGESRRRGAIVVSAVIGFQQFTAGGWHAGPAAGPHDLVTTLFAMATDVSVDSASRYPVRNDERARAEGPSAS